MAKYLHILIFVFLVWTQQTFAQCAQSIVFPSVQSNAASHINSSNYSIGNSQLTLQNTSTQAFTNRITTNHQSALSITIGHGGDANTFAKRVETTMQFSQPVSNLNFNINDLDAGDRIRIQAYDQNNNLINFGAGNYSLTSGSIITYTASPDKEFSSSIVDVSSSDANTTARLAVNFNTFLVSRVVIQYYDVAAAGSYTIANIRGAVVCANPDSFSVNVGVNSTTPTILTNDLHFGTPATAANVTPTIVGTWTPGITLNANGTVSVSSTVPAGIYPLQYRICSNTNPNSCSTTTVTITVKNNADSDGDGIPDDEDLDDDNDGILDTVECPPTQIVTNGTFNSNASGWTLNGWGYEPNKVTNYNDAVNETLSQTINNLDKAGNPITLSFTIGGGDRGHVGGYTASLDVILNGVVYGTFSNSTVRTAGTNNVTLALSNGATATFSPFSTAGVNGFVTRSVIIKIPNPGVATATLGFRMNANGDDWSLDDISINASICDTDGDGIPNHLDLDSDNDGCPDAIEGASTTITPANLFNSSMPGGNVGATSGNYNQPVIQNLGNTVNTTPGSASYGVPIIAGSGQAVGQALTVNPAAVPGTAAANQTIPINTSPAPLTLTGFTGSIQWQVSSDNISFANVASGGTTANYSPGSLSATRYFRALVSSAGGCSEVSNVVTITVCPAGNIAPSVTTYIENNCTQASVNLNTLHNGTTPANAELVWFTTSTPGDSPLSATQLANAPAGTYYAFYYSENADCYSPASAAVTVYIDALDSDGDGIFDKCDLDDDNDGILDTAESSPCYSCTLGTTNTWTSYQTFVTNNTILPPAVDESVNLFSQNPEAIISTKFPHKDPFGFGIPWYNDMTLKATNNAFGTIDELSATSAHSEWHVNLAVWQPPVAMANKTLRIRTNNFGFYANPTGRTETSKLFAMINNGVSPMVPAAAGLDFNFNELSLGTWNGTSCVILALYNFDQSLRLDETADIEYWNGTAWVNLPTSAVSALPARIPGCTNDFDGDGIPNHLDLDSDNDGCYDAIEGGENVVQTHLTGGGSIRTNAAGTPNPNSIASVDANGVPLLVNNGGAADTATPTAGSVGQPRGSSQDASIAPCCTNPPTPGTPDGYTQTGISNLQGFANGWPNNVPNGFIAIESKNKGFVITRIQNVSLIPVADLVPGMLVYDLDADCVKLYNGSYWNCIQKDCGVPTN